MLFRRKEIPWEVVATKHVEPIALFDEFDDDGETISCTTYCFRVRSLTFGPADLDVLRVSDVDMRATFAHEIKGIQDMRRVICTTRHLLMQTVYRQKYNILLSEG